MIERKEDVPAKFYKYRSMSGESAKWIESTVLHNEIYFPPASSFNDPFDLRPVFSLNASPQQQREDFIRLSKKYKPHLTEAQHQAEADRVMASSLNTESIESTRAGIQVTASHVLTTELGVLCVSTRGDDILLWSHYADSHRGVCLEFDGTFAFMAQAQKVTYSSDRSPINPYADDRETMLTKALLTKSAQWSYESEWRLIRHDGGPGVVCFRPQNLTGIILGALASRSTIEIVRKWAGERSIPVKLYQAFTSNTSFALDIHPC